jgi:large subunit ribosomal protein L29
MSDKRIQMKDLEGLSIKDLVSKRTELRKKLFSLKMQNQAGALKQTHLIKLTRRNIARVNTALSIKIKEQK